MTKRNLEQCLKRAGYEVVASFEGRTVYRHLRNREPLAVIIDRLESATRVTVSLEETSFDCRISDLDRGIDLQGQEVLCLKVRL
jgi:hypothetical protein